MITDADIEELQAYSDANNLDLTEIDLQQRLESGSSYAGRVRDKYIAGFFTDVQKHATISQPDS